MGRKIRHILKLTILTGLLGFLGSAIIQAAVRVLFSGDGSLFKLPPFSLESSISSLLTMTMIGAVCGFVLGVIRKPGGRSANERKDAATTVSQPATSQPITNTDSKPEVPVPAWMNQSGWLAAATGVVGFLASAYVDYNRPTGGEDVLGAALAGVLNPLFFIGFPLGMYWLSRSGAFTEVDENHKPPKSN